MRLDLSRIRDIDRTIVLMIVAVAAGIGISAWLVSDVSKREKAAQELEAEVRQSEAQAAALPAQAAPPLSQQELEDKIRGLVNPPDAEQALQQEIAALATVHHIDVQGIAPTATPVDPANTEGENLVLVAMGILSYLDFTIEFQATYEDIARFVDTLEKRPQRLLIRTLDLRRTTHPVIGGKLVLRAYQKGS